MIETKLVLINQNTLEALEEIDATKIVERFNKTAMDILSADFGFMFWKFLLQLHRKCFGKRFNLRI